MDQDDILKDVSKTNQTLGEFIRDKRTEHGVSLRELARRLKISSAHLSDIEQGKRYPSGAVLIRIAKELGVQPSELRSRDTRFSFDDLRRILARHPELESALNGAVHALKTRRITPTKLVTLLSEAATKK